MDNTGSTSAYRARIAQEKAVVKPEVESAAKAIGL